jgi:hypothetical protein
MQNEPRHARGFFVGDSRLHEGRVESAAWTPASATA